MIRAVSAAADHVGPVYLRSSREPLPHVYPDGDCPFHIGKANVVRRGRDVTIIACGLMVPVALDAAVILSAEGLEARVVDMHTVKPVDEEVIEAAARETGAIVTAEEHLIRGGLGSAVAQAVVRTHPVPMRFIGLNNTYAGSGTMPELMLKLGLMDEHVATAAREAVAAKSLSE
jgi:transketolase